MQSQKLVAKDGQDEDRFATGLAVTKNAVAVGAPSDDSKAAMARGRCTCSGRQLDNVHISMYARTNEWYTDLSNVSPGGLDGGHP
jgi:hypothetical protein